jgi:hypothetical protein
LGRDPLEFADSANHYKANFVFSSRDPSGMSSSASDDIAMCKSFLWGAVGYGGFLKDYPCASALLKNFLTGGMNNCPKACTDAITGSRQWSDLFYGILQSKTTCGFSGRFEGNGYEMPINFEKGDMHWAFNWATYRFSDYACAWKCGNGTKYCNGVTCCPCDATCGFTGMILSDRYDFCSSLPNNGPIDPLSEGLGPTVAKCGCVLERNLGLGFDVRCQFGHHSDLKIAITKCTID